MSTTDDSEATVSAASSAETDTTKRCPLDNSAVEPFDAGYVVCARCREILAPEETVAQATPETWAAYLIAGGTDTDPEDAPLSRLQAATT